MSLTKKLIIGGTLLTLLGLGGIALHNPDFRKYVHKRLVDYGPIVLGTAGGVLLTETKPIRRFIDKVEYAAGRAVLGYKD